MAMKKIDGHLQKMFQESFTERGKNTTGLKT